MLSSVAFASLDDNKISIQQQYGDYRLVIDTDNQLWTKADWEVKGFQRAKASAYHYSFSRQGLGVQMEVMFANDKPDAQVVAQRFTPDMPITIKDFKLYFPEVYALMQTPKARTIATYNGLSHNFQEQQSPVAMGVVVRELSKKGSYYPLIAFNIQDQGRLIKDIAYIDENTYIREFTIERASQTTVHEALDTSRPSWYSIKNYF
jgi:hypothetical protein